uniref:Tachylectin 2 domain-containing protein n=1 Tax=Engystomops pustulosus TaxID=76066 RepID=A0AAV6Z1N4_ENGPU|nr:hypothetical protein GDO81_020192 [Engystomops pustulosus]
MRVESPNKPLTDDCAARAAVVGKLQNVRHVLCSPDGVLFCVRGGDLYRGPIPSNKDLDWFSMARRVGKDEWSGFKILFFHQDGELCATTNNGEFYKGPRPDNENVSWTNRQDTKKIGKSGWEQCDALFFAPDGDLYAVTKQDKIMKGKPPTTAQDCEEWLKTCTMVGGCGWLRLSHFMSFSPDGKLWSVDKQNGNLYSGIIPEDGRYLDNSQNLGSDYHQIPFLCFIKDKTIHNIIRFQFLPKEGKKGSENIEVIAEKIYTNTESSPVTYTFTFEKTLKVSSFFTDEHGFPLQLGAGITFKAGIPFFSQNKKSAEIKLGAAHNWSFTDSNETEVKFSSNSEVEVPPGKTMKLVASVVKTDLVVPYRAKVRTIFGSKIEMTGTWHGAAHYNLMVKQEK